MKKEKGFGSFFLPGPTEVRSEVLEAMLGPMIPHRSAAFEDLFARLQAGLRHLFQTRRPVYILAASGTGMMEAAIRALPDGTILSLVNGAFSEKFAHIAEACGRDVDRYEVPWGSVHTVSELDSFLSTKKYRAITVCHSETSTGALNQIRYLSDAAHSRGVLCMIDSVSGLGGAEVRFDDWQLDYVLTGSQKCLALPPGLAFAVASDEMVRLAESAKARGAYFDIVEMEKHATTNQVPATPALSLLYALDIQLETISRDGIENRWKRHGEMATATSQWIGDSAIRLGIEWKNIVADGSRSPTVSAIQLPARLSGKEFTQKVKSKGIQLGGGYGKLSESTFRIGHMGDHSVTTLQNCFEACEEAIKD